MKAIFQKKTKLLWVLWGTALYNQLYLERTHGALTNTGRKVRWHIFLSIKDRINHRLESSHQSITAVTGIWDCSRWKLVSHHNRRSCIQKIYLHCELEYRNGTCRLVRSFLEQWAPSFGRCVKDKKPDYGRCIGINQQTSGKWKKLKTKPDKMVIDCSEERWTVDFSASVMTGLRANFIQWFMSA